ncbi:MAG: L-ribulose-5-phosphate 4-epimerase [Clostridiales bacterium]|nr:L-ribulose-5-phosphate 4-epimerase [Clostridiales bacterium]
MESLKEAVFEANLSLVRHGLVLFTWGNVSAIDRESGRIVIKPSGLSYADMKAEDMVVVDLSGQVVEGRLNPSSDTPTHIELYKAFPKIGGVTHTHSTYAAAWAQAGRDLPCLGTTHADYFYGAVPCARPLTKTEIERAYETNTGLVITETFKKNDYAACPGVLVHAHGPFTWGRDADEAVYHAVVLEEIAKMATLTKQIRPQGALIYADQALQDKHYFRKHGKNAYYGQEKKS